MIVLGTVSEETRGLPPFDVAEFPGSIDRREDA